MSQTLNPSPTFLSRQWQPYPSYKRSGVEWLGEVPEHWEVRKLKFASPSSSEKLTGKPEELTYVGLENLESKTGRLLLGSPTEDIDSIVSVFCPGDVLFGKLRPYLGKVFYSDFLGICTGELMVLRPVSEVMDGKYLAYLLLSDSFIGLVDSTTYGAKMPRANPNEILNIQICRPSLDEQKQIARFLDRETTRIDTLITKKRQLIALLQKKRDAIIYEAVTKGIDDQLLISQGVGFDWCWNVSKEWDVVRLKFIAGVQTGLTLGKDYKNRTVVSRPYLRVANVQDGFLDLSEITEIEIPSEDVSRYELKTRDVLMTEGGDFDKLGRGYVWEGQIEGCLHQNHVFAVRPHAKYLDSHYLSAIMTSYYGKAYFTSTSQQTTNLATTNSTKLGNFPLPLPSINQQDEILRELDSKLSKLFSVINKLNEQIGYMQKHRLSLITAAVTGKIDVREEVN